MIHLYHVCGCLTTTGNCVRSLKSIFYWKTDLTEVNLPGEHKTADVSQNKINVTACTHFRSISQKFHNYSI